MKKNTDPSVYLDASLRCVPRLLGLLNRNPVSHTYGCFDRNYWHYKIVDFSNGRQQEAALTLALLYTIDHERNMYYNQKKIKSWSLAAVNFLTNIQNNDGSFNEYYPHEHAFVTTAFVAFAASEALLLLEEYPPDVVDVLVQAGKFLLTRHELEVVNQNLGAAAALQNIYLLTNNEMFQKGALAKLDLSLQQQSPEGWFYEYGGPDIGYLSVAASYLGHYYRKTDHKKALSKLKKAIYFLSHFLHPDGTAGGEYASRNTVYLVPDGIEICAQHSEYGSYASSHIRKWLLKGGVAPFHLDDRYLCNMLYTYLYAFLLCNPVKKIQPESTFFPESGLLMKKSNDSMFIANLRKGGTCKLFRHGNMVLSDSGAVGRLSDGRIVSSQWLGTSYTKNKDEKEKYTVAGPLVVVPEQEMTPLKTILMRTSLSLGGKFLSHFAKKHLRKRLITQKSTVPVLFRREIVFGDTIDITDTIYTESNAIFEELYLLDHAALIYIPSSRYFQSSELKTPLCLTDNLAESFNKKRKITLNRII